MFNPYGAYQPMIPQVQQAQKHEIVKVHGKGGAETFMNSMAVNSSILLLDETDPIIWLAQTDGAGYKTLSAYKIEPYREETLTDLKSLEERVNKLEEQINESYTANVKHKQNNEQSTNKQNHNN